MAPVIEMFVQELQDRIDALDAAFRQERWEDLRRLAHQLRGAGGGYGFPDITDAAAQLEDALSREPAGPSAAAATGLRRLIETCRRADAGQGSDPS